VLTACIVVGRRSDRKLTDTIAVEIVQRGQRVTEAVPIVQVTGEAAFGAADLLV